MLYAVRFAVTQKIDVCSDDELKKANEKVFEKTDRDKFELELDKEKFNQKCLDINEILSKEGYFLRVYELKKKFRELTLKSSKQQNIIRQLSSCVHEKFDGFHIVCVEYSKKARKKFRPINIIYKPVRQIEKKILCFGSKDMSRAYRSSCSQGEKVLHGFAFECYFCGKFFCQSR